MKTAVTLDLASYSETYVSQIENRLKQLMTQENVRHKLYDAASYSLLGGGKRLRPLIALATAEALGASIEAALDPACALEMVHTYSLIHDDLPCMDDDDFRRGRPTLHRVFPEGHAVLTGDYLLTEAFEVVASAPLLTSNQKIDLVLTLARAAGGRGMVGGQVMDIEAGEKQINLQDLQHIHECKTAALLSAAFEFGGIIAHVSAQIVANLKTIGLRLGLAFQVVDDILDVTASEAKHGTCSDANNGKTTYVSLMGLEPSRMLAAELLSEALSLVQQLPGKTQFLTTLCRRLVERAI